MPDRDFCEELRGLLEKATPGPWRIVTHKGETENGYPVECDWDCIDGPDGKPVELENMHGDNAALAMLLRNHADAILRVVEIAKEMRLTDQMNSGMDKALAALDNPPIAGKE